MSFVAAAPEIMTSAAKDLADIGSALTAANRAAVTQTTGVLAAAEDEVSAAIAALFSAHGQGFQALSAQAAAFHDQFVQALTAGAGSYVGAEAANASLLQSSNVIAGSMDGVVSRLDNALGDIPPGQSMHTPFIPAATMPNPFFGFPPGQLMHSEFIPGTTIPNPFFGFPPGRIMHTEFIPGTTIPNPFFGFPPGQLMHTPFIPAATMPNPFFGFPPGQLMHSKIIPGTTIPNPFFGFAPGRIMHTEFIPGTMNPNPFFGFPPGQLMHTPFIPAANVAAFTANPAASATAAQVAPLQSLNGLATRLAATLGFSPVINPVPGDPDFMSQTTNFGGLFSTTSLADPDDNNFVAASFVSPLFKAAATSGFEPTVRLGAPGQTILTFQSPVAPFLNSSIALPVTDPIAPLFTALLPLGL